MARLPIIPDVARVVFKLEANNPPTPVVNVTHIQRDPTVVWTTIADHVVASVEVAGALDMFRAVQNSWLFSEIHVTPLDGSSSTIIRTRGAAVWPDGGGTGDAIPAAAAIVKFATAKRGKSYRGRAYCGPIAEGVQNNGILDSTVVTDMGAAWRAYLDKLLSFGSPVVPVVASYKLRTAEPVTDTGVHNRIGTQRRRQHY